MRSAMPAAAAGGAAAEPGYSGSLIHPLVEPKLSSPKHTSGLSFNVSAPHRIYPGGAQHLDPDTNAARVGVANRLGG
jgi:hypothetical protein